MTGAEIIALLGAVGTGVAGSAVYDALKNAKALLPINSDRKKAISKKWSGSFTQVQSDSTVLAFSITFTLKAKRKFITGTGAYSGENEKVQIELAGGFYRDDYLHLNYKNKDKAVFQHGLIILHWPNNPTTLKGKFIGIGRDSNEIVSGNVELKK